MSSSPLFLPLSSHAPPFSSSPSRFNLQHFLLHSSPNLKPKPTISSHFTLRTSFLSFSPILRTCSILRHVTSAIPPSEEPQDPLGNDPTTGLEATFFRIQDGAQIFFAVLFWMSVFFWASTSDGRDNVRPKNGSRFRR